MINSEEIHQWVSSKRIAERSLRQLRQFLSICQKKDPQFFERISDDFEEKFLELKIEDICLWLGNWPEYDERYIIVQIPLVYKKTFYKKKGEKIYFNEGKASMTHIGTYKLHFDLEGNIYDETAEWY